MPQERQTEIRIEESRRALPGGFLLSAVRLCERSACMPFAARPAKVFCRAFFKKTGAKSTPALRRMLWILLVGMAASEQGALRPAAAFFMRAAARGARRRPRKIGRKLLIAQCLSRCSRRSRLKFFAEAFFQKGRKVFAGLF
ncbi:hypothetical protein [Anaerotruncus colihominis]|uniref:hypothetical protein n=1 Tax=Anaerotruncus colihominis TaxID=169435 RepID=UPI001898620F|nr:hypothetical protein [Anaerotruncus colihominis]